MKMTKKIQIILMIFILSISHYKVIAQNDSIQDNSYYFDDGGISESKSLVKINVFSIVNGDLPVYYERIIGKSFSIEFGAGILLPYYIPELPQLFSGESEIANPDFGHSIWIHPKYYVQHESPELNYLGIQIRRRNYNQDNQTIIFTDLTFNYGLQLIVGKRLVFDCNVGVGFRYKTQESLNIEKEISGLAFPIGIKLGIIL